MSILLFPVAFKAVFTRIIPVAVNENTAVNLFQERGVSSVNDDYAEGINI